MNVWRDMARDAGLHHGTGLTLDQAARWLEEQYRQEEERLAYEAWIAEQAEAADE